MEKSESFIDKIKDASLRYAGLGYLVGDASIITRGIVSKNPSVAITGLAWGSGGLGMAAFGKKTQNYQLKELSLDLADHLADQDIATPKGSEIDLRYLQKPNSLFNKVERFAYNHPSEILNTVYAAGSLFLIKGGYKEFKKNGDKSDMISGALVLGGALSGLFIKEKQPSLNEDGTEKKPENIIEWIQEKPLRLTGTLYSLNNIFPLMAAIKGHRSGGDKAVYSLRYGQVGAFAAANGLLSMSNKGHEGESADLPMDHFLKYASEVVTMQPAEKQPQALEAIATFMADDKRFDISKEEALAKLQTASPNRALPSPQVNQATTDGQLARSPLQSQAV